MSFTPRTVVNGSLLRSHLNREVTILVNIETADSSRRNLRARSTDNVELTIRTDDPVGTKGWVEVIGVPASATDIKAKEVEFTFFKCNKCFNLIYFRLFSSSRRQRMSRLMRNRTICWSTL